MAKQGEPLHFRDRRQWRRWLSRNHSRTRGVWIIFFKGDRRGEGVTKPAALEEALCFGWIDSQVKKLDHDRFIQWFSPRRPGSIWSLINKRTVQRLIREGRMTEAGLAKVREAKRNGRWAAAYTSRREVAVPADLRKALRSGGAWEIFAGLTPSHRTRYVEWVAGAKKKETRRRRIERTVRMVLDGAP